MGNFKKGERFQKGWPGKFCGESFLQQLQNFNTNTKLLTTIRNEQIP
jgi:hypothetical protein